MFSIIASVKSELPLYRCIFNSQILEQNCAILFMILNFLFQILLFNSGLQFCYFNQCLQIEIFTSVIYVSFSTVYT